LVAVVRHVDTGGGVPFLYVLSDLEGKELRQKFHAEDLKPAPPLKDIKFVVQSVLQKQGDRWKVVFQYYSR